MNKINVVCKHCSKGYTTQGNLNRHLYEKHGLNSEGAAYDINMKSFKCLEGCNISFTYHIELVRHLEEEHDFLVEKEEQCFPSIVEFLVWLGELQSLNYVEYIKGSGKALTHEEDSVIYYICNRSGKPRGISNINKRMKKTQGSKKINMSCTSRIKLVISKSSDLVSMTFWKTHYGHDFDIQHLRIPKEERTHIAQKLALGVSMTKILDTNKDNFDEDNLKRIDLLTRKDLHNIKSSYNIEIQGVRNPLDAINVDTYVKECYQTESNPVIFYKPQNSEDDCEDLEYGDFCLIIMNSSQKSMLMKFGHNVIAIDSTTHRSNSYDLELTTLLVIDDWGEGFPVACMLTNRNDDFIFYLFFQKLREHVGDWNPQTVMTDITDVFCNPWKHAIGDASNHIYCPWHIEHAWQKNINKINVADKRQHVYDTLKQLQTLDNKQEFDETLSNFLTELIEDHDTYNFGLYFENNYVHTYEKWAYCYHQNNSINTNVRLDKMRKIIKYIYLEENTIKRLEKGLYALNKYIRDKTVDRIIKKIKGNNSRHVHNIHVRHKTAVTDNFEITQQDSDNWTVIDKTSDGDQLSSCTVSKTALADPCCYLACEMCYVCVHSFVCSCPDFFINNTICKHIHSVVIQEREAANNSDEENIILMTVENSEDEISEHLENLSHENINTNENCDGNEYIDIYENNDTIENNETYEDNNTNENNEETSEYLNNFSDENIDTNENCDIKEDNETYEYSDTSQNNCTNEINNTNKDSDESSENLKKLSENCDTKYMDNLLLNITMLTSKLTENVKKVQNIEVLKHVERTLRTENILIEYDLKKQQNKEPAITDIVEQSYQATKKRKRTIRHISMPNVKEEKVNQNLVYYISRTTQNDHSYL